MDFRLDTFDKIILLTLCILIICPYNTNSIEDKCKGNGSKLKYLWGDALTDSPDCIGPNDTPYPRHLINRSLKMGAWGGNSRTARMGFKTTDPYLMQRALLNNYAASKDDTINNRTKRAMTESGCRSEVGGRLCKTRYNTTAPMYGVSLTSGQPVTIVQKFPDLLQQVVFEVCESRSCAVVRGACTQTYVPYLFLVLPLGPVTLTGQDYVLVESGCVCKPEAVGYGPDNNPITGIH